MPPRNAVTKQQELQITEFVGAQGMETREQRDALQPGWWSWLMNFQCIGNRTLRVLKGKGSTLYTAPTGDSIICYFPFIVGSTYYFVVFLTSGKADQVKISDGTVTHISTSANKFWNGTGQYPHIVNWGNSGILIVSTVGSDSYWAWDGTLYSPSGSAPTWLYPSGSSHTTMPTGIKGTAIEIYNSQVWIVNGRTIIASAPAVGTDFATSDGGVSLTVTDAYVQDGYWALKSLDGFLYLFAGSAVDVISDVQTTGATPTTTFLRVPVSTSIGSPWRDSVVGTPTSILCANTTGIFEVQGGTLRKVSSSFDGIFETSSFPVSSSDPSGYHPSAALVHLNELPCYALTMVVNDPDTGVAINAVALWDGNRWFLGTAETQPSFVGMRNADSVFTLWGSDLTTIYQMFSTASTSLTKKAKSWMTATQSGISMRKMLKRIYAQFANAPSGNPLTEFNIDTETSTFSTTAVGQPGIITFVNNSGVTIQFQNNSGQNINFTGIYPFVAAGNANGVICIFFGVTIAATLGALDVVGIGVGFIDYSRYE